MRTTEGQEGPGVGAGVGLVGSRSDRGFISSLDGRRTVETVTTGTASEIGESGTEDVRGGLTRETG